MGGGDRAPMAVNLSAIGYAAIEPWVVDSGGDGASGGGAVEEKGNGKDESLHVVCYRQRKSPPKGLGLSSERQERLPSA